MEAGDWWRRRLTTGVANVDRRVVALGIARMGEAVGISFLIVVLPLYIASDLVTGEFFGLTEAAITGIILSIFGFVNSPLQPLVGRFSDRIRRRKVLILFGLAMLATTSFAYSFANTYWQLVLFRVLQGVAAAFIIPTTIALVNEFATQETRGENMGLYSSFLLSGFAVGPIGAGVVIAGGPYQLALGGLRIGFNGFEAAFYFATGTAVLGFVLISALVHDPGTGDMDTAGEDENGDRPSENGGFSVFAPNRATILNSVFVLGVINIVIGLALGLFAPLQDIVNTRLGQGPTLFGVQFAAYAIAQIALQTPIGRASDRYGRRPFLLGGMALFAVGTLMQGIVLDPWSMIGARLIQGVGGALVYTPALALAGDLASEGESGATLSVLTTGFTLGLAFGPLLSGFLVAYGFLVPFAFGTALSVLGVALIYTQVEETVTRTDGPTRTE